MKKSDLDRLSKLQNLFLNTILNVQKCPTPLMYFDLAFLTIPLRILKEKLNLYHHISSLPESAISSQVLEIQWRLQLPGLHNDVENFLIENEICDVKSFSKVEWKSLIRRKINLMNRDRLIEDARKYKKIDYLSMACEDYEM